MEWIASKSLQMPQVATKPKAKGPTSTDAKSKVVDAPIVRKKDKKGDQEGSPPMVEIKEAGETGGSPHTAIKKEAEGKGE